MSSRRAAAPREADRLRTPPAALDRRLLYGAAFVRALATGLVGVLLGVHLARLGYDEGRIGLVVAAGLAGAALAALIVTFAGDRLGRRRALVAVAALGAVGGAVLAASEPFAALLGASFLGMVNGMGRDRGAALVLDQVILASTAADAERTAAFARYNVLQDVGHALGALLAGAPVLLRRLLPLGEVASLRATLLVYAALLATAALLYGRLSAGVEGLAARERPPVSPETRRILTRISALFAFDSLAGGFLTTALLSLFFFERFQVSEAVVGLLFFGARLANAASHLGAAWLARRIGLLNTMVFTHVPSSLLLATVVFAPSFGVAAALFLLREGLVEMDVPTRQSLVMALVRPEERTLASGVTHLVRLGAWALAPGFAGFLMSASPATPVFIGAGMKLAYDGLLYAALRRYRPPEERTARPPAPVDEESPAAAGARPPDDYDAPGGDVA
jgi:MFS family permease